MAEDRCRLCLESGSATLPIFQKKHGVALAKLTDILQIELRVGNGLPGRICSACVSRLDSAYSFKQRCLASQKELKDQTMRTVRKASAGARARRQATKYSDSDTNSNIDRGSDSDTKESKSDEEYQPIGKMPTISLLTEDDSKNGNAKVKKGIGRKKTKTPSKNDDAGSLECRLCDSKFVTAAQRENHLDSHEEKTEKSNKCLVCKKRFPSQSELRAHLQLHVGESPVQCSRCDKVFLNETYLGYHFESHSRPAPDGFNVKPFKCDTCNKSFLKQAHLVEHVRSHTGDRPFKCPSCDKSFTTKCNLTRHGRTHLAI